MTSSKLERLNQSIKKALGLLIREVLPDHPLLVVNDVLIDPSFKTGRVWVKATHMELLLLEGKRADIQHKLGDKLKIRYTPKLTFLADDRYLENLDQLFDQITEK